MANETRLVGDSPAIKKLRKDITQLAKKRRPLLIKGEVGTGRGLVAQLIFESIDAKALIVTLTPLTATDADLKTSLERPSPGGAMYLFRDIELFSFLHQTMIQRFIEQVPKKNSPPLIVTTRALLADSRREKKIVEELHETIRTYDLVSLPPLAQRTGDIPLLVEYFIKNACDSIGVALKAIDINVLDFLVRREWTENVRELKAVIERAVFTSEGESIELPEHLVDEYSQLEGIMSNIKGRKAFAFDKSLSNLEKTLIERTLEAVGYNQSRAAELLHLSEANLRYRLKKFHIPTLKDKHAP